MIFGSAKAPGGPPGLQNQCTGDEPVGGFDSHALPPFIFHIINYSSNFQVGASGRKGQIGSDTGRIELLLPLP